MKIIISNKANEHMKPHESDFLVSWKDLVRKCENENKVIRLKGDFEVVELEFDYPIGYCNLVSTKESDEIVYARRVGRDNYTRFVKNTTPDTTRYLTIILKKNMRKHDEYYLITMFPGKSNFKEPEDLNIKSKKELIDSLEFWNKHALVLNKEIIIPESIKTYCPYKNLYLSLSIS